MEKEKVNGNDEENKRREEDGKVSRLKEKKQTKRIKDAS